MASLRQGLGQALRVVTYGSDLRSSLRGSLAGSLGNQQFVCVLFLYVVFPTRLTGCRGLSLVPRSTPGHSSFLRLLEDRVFVTSASILFHKGRTLHRCGPSKKNSRGLRPPAPRSRPRTSPVCCVLFLSGVSIRRSFQLQLQSWELPH